MNFSIRISFCWNFTFINHISNIIFISTWTLYSSYLPAIFNTHITFFYRQCINLCIRTNNSCIRSWRNNKHSNCTLLDINFTIRYICNDFRNSYIFWNFYNNLSFIRTAFFIYYRNLGIICYGSKRKGCCFSSQFLRNFNYIVFSCHFIGYSNSQFLFACWQNILINIFYIRNGFVNAITTSQCTFTIFSPYNITTSNSFICIRSRKFCSTLNFYPNLYIVCTCRNWDIKDHCFRCSVHGASIIYSHNVRIFFSCFKKRIIRRQICNKLSCDSFGSFNRKHMLTSKCPIIKLKHCNCA